MAIRIGDDGTIINGDQIISSSGTVIRDDGTIESSNIGNNSFQQRTYISHDAPVSPLENGSSQHTTINEGNSNTNVQLEQRESTELTRSVADLEYDIIVAEGHAKGAIPKKSIIILIIMLISGLIIHPIFLIGTAIAGVLVFIGFYKKSSFEEEIRRLKSEIETIKRQQR